MGKVQFVHYLDETITYLHNGEWYKIPFFVLEDYSNEFFLEQWADRDKIPHEETKAYLLLKLLNREFNTLYWNQDEHSESPVIKLFKQLFCDQLEADFKAYQLFNYA